MVFANFAGPANFNGLFLPSFFVHAARVFSKEFSTRLDSFKVFLPGIWLPSGFAAAAQLFV